MATTNHVTKVAIVGATGNVGKHITSALLKTDKHKITVLTRESNNNNTNNNKDTRSFPQNVTIKPINYSNPSTIIEALKDQDVLIITLSGHAPKETDGLLIEAAGRAGVKWILPNEWSPDSGNEKLVGDVFVFAEKVKNRKKIEDLNMSSYISVCTGFWYEWSLAMPAAFGIDFVSRKATFFDDGDTKISVSTWPQIGCAVAALLSLPITPEESPNINNNASPCLESLRNKIIYISSFTINQREMLNSALRVTNTKETDWTITHEPSEDRYASGIAQIKEGQRIGFAKMMYTRVFYRDGCGNLEGKETFVNGLLGLEKEDVDDATGVALERSKMANWLS